MRAGRLLSVLLLLQVHGHLTARQIAMQLEVSERTALRDLDALAASGVPLYAQRGAGGGWFLPESFRSQVTGLTQAELDALIAVQPGRLLEDLGFDEAARAAVLKLVATSAGREHAASTRMTERIHIDVPSWRRDVEPVPHLPALQQALWLDRCVRMTYHRADGSQTERTVSPLGLVAKGHLWYMVAAHEGNIRTYRVSRISDVALVEEPAQRPADFDLAAWWTSSTSTFVSRLPQYPVTLRADRSVLQQVERPGGWVQVREVVQLNDGSVLLDLLFETEDDACRFVLTFAERVAVVEPQELRHHVVRLANIVLQRHSQSAEADGSVARCERGPSRQPEVVNDEDL